MLSGNGPDQVSFHSSSICRSLVSHCAAVFCVGTAVDVSLTSEVCMAVTRQFCEFFFSFSPDVVHIFSGLWVLGAWYSGGSKSQKLCWEAERGFSESKGLAGFWVLRLWVLGFWVLRFWVLTLGCWCLSSGGCVQNVLIRDQKQVHQVQGFG